MQSSDDCFHLTTLVFSCSGSRLPRARHEEHQDGVTVDFDIRAWPRTLFVCRPIAPRPIDLDEMTLPDVAAWQPRYIRELHDQSRLAIRDLPSLQPAQSVCKVRPHRVSFPSAPRPRAPIPLPALRWPSLLSFRWNESMKTRK